MKSVRLFIARNGGASIALGLFLILYIFYSAQHPKGFTSDLYVQNSNETLALILLSMGQTLPVLLGGIDLSIGSLMTLVDSLASEVVRGTPAQIALGMALCVATGMLGGLINGLVIVYGRLQPIVVTLATGAIASGVALFIRPTPGGEVNGDLGWMATNAIGEVPATLGWWNGSPPAWFNLMAGVPMPLVILAFIVVVFWLPYRSSEIGRAAYAVGSNESASYMSGVRINRAKLGAYVMGGLFAGLAGLYFAVQTGSGNADPVQAGTYTLNSIAAVVIGGTSMLGGSGGVIGSIFGAAVLRAITFCFRVVDANSVFGFVANPLLQPMFEGVILLLAVSLGAAKILRMKNRLDAYR